jgi:hypothetical protein
LRGSYPIRLLQRGAREIGGFGEAGLRTKEIQVWIACQWVFGVGDFFTAETPRKTESEGGDFERIGSAGIGGAAGELVLHDAAGGHVFRASIQFFVAGIG